MAFAAPAFLAYIATMNEHSPIVSEFDTPEQEASYLEWLKRKVAASLADPGPGVPHDEVMASVQSIIDEAKARKGA
jgi:hypothetical protein